MAVLDDMIKAAGDVAKGARRYDEAFEVELAAATQANKAKTTLNESKLRAILERETEELNRANAGVDRSKTRLDLQDENDALVAEFEIQQETARVAGITDPAADVDIRFQTNGPEEYKARMSQLRNEEYAAKAVLQIPGSPNAGPSAKEIAQGLAIDENFQQIVKQNRKSPRQEAAIKAAVGDTPYSALDGTPQVMVHIDGMTDPVRANTGEFIQQLDEAYEVGVHSGTNEAAIRATIKDPDQTRMRIEDFDAEIIELDGLADMDGQLKSRFATTLNEFFTQKFTVGDDAARSPAIFDEFQDFARTALRRLGIEEDVVESEVRRFTARMRQMPLANSTPHYFNGQNGLLMADTGGWKPQAVFDQLQEIFPSQSQELDALFGNATGQAAKTSAIRKFIEDQGYDHIVYHNTVEDIGSLSVIHWKPEQMIPITDVRVTGDTANSKGAAMASYIMGGVFGGQAIQQTTE